MVLPALAAERRAVVAFRQCLGEGETQREEGNTLEVQLHQAPLQLSSWKSLSGSSVMLFSAALI